MFHVHSSCTSNMKNNKGNLTKASVSSRHRVEPESITSIMIMIFSIDVIPRNSSTKRDTFILNCFIQFTCTNLDGCKKEEVTFLICFRKRGVPRKEGVPQKRGGGPTLEETMPLT